MDLFNYWINTFGNSVYSKKIRTVRNLTSKARMFQIGISLVSILCLSVGVFRNEVDLIFRKAVNICLECIGIG